QAAPSVVAPNAAARRSAMTPDADPAAAERGAVAPRERPAGDCGASGRRPARAVRAPSASSAPCAERVMHHRVTVVAVELPATSARLGERGLAAHDVREALEAAEERRRLGVQVDEHARGT